MPRTYVRKIPPPETKKPLPATPLDQMEVGDWFAITLERQTQYDTLCKRINRFKHANPGTNFRMESQGPTNEYPLRVHVQRIAPDTTPIPTVRIIRNGTP